MITLFIIFIALVWFIGPLMLLADAIETREPGSIWNAVGILVLIYGLTIYACF